MNFNKVTWWRNIALETAKKENQEKHGNTEMLHSIPIDAELDGEFKNVLFDNNILNN